MIVIADSNIFISCFYSPNGTIAGILSYEKNVQFIAFERNHKKHQTE